MEENKEIDVFMSRQTPLVFPFEKLKVHFEIINIGRYELLPPSPSTFQIGFPQGNVSLDNDQYREYARKLDRLIHLNYTEPSRQKSSFEEAKIYEGPEHIKKIRKGKGASKISLSDKLRILEYTRNYPEYSGRFIASVFGVSYSLVRKIGFCQNNESLLIYKRTNFRSTLTEDIRNKIDLICSSQDPTLSVNEKTKMLNSTYGYNIEQHQVYYYMKKMKYSYKSSRIHPYKRKEEANIIKRQVFATKFTDILKEEKHIINIDEFSIDYSKRNYGGSKTGSKCLAYNTSLKRSYSIIIAVSSGNGIIAGRAIGENNSTIAKIFNHFIINLVEYLFAKDQAFREYSVFLLDNSKIHCSRKNNEIFTKLGLNVVFGGPYTPQFVFVENVIGYMKRIIKIKEDTLLEKNKKIREGNGRKKGYGKNPWAYSENLYIESIEIGRFGGLI